MYEAQGGPLNPSRISLALNLFSTSKSTSTRTGNMAGSRPVGSTPILPQLPSMSPLSLYIASQGESFLQGRKAIRRSPRAVQDLSSINGYMKESHRPSNDHFSDFDGDFTDRHKPGESSSPDAHMQDILAAGMTERRQPLPSEDSAVDIWTMVDVGRRSDNIPPPPRSEVKRYSKKRLPSTPPASAARREAAVAKMVKSVHVYNTSEHMHWEGKRSLTGAIDFVDEYEEPTEVSVRTHVTLTTSEPMTWHNRNQRRATFDHKGLVAHNRPATDIERFYMSYDGPHARQSEIR